MTFQDIKDYYIKTITQMRREFEGDHTPLSGEDFKMENLIKEYSRLISLDNTYEEEY